MNAPVVVKELEPLPLEACLKYLRDNEWQFKLLYEHSPVRISARVLFSVQHHLKELETRQSCDKREGA